MDGLTIENVRCFKGQISAPLAPLTLLIGENSTGKSTFLAMTRLAWDLGAGDGIPDFNESPFRLGTYDHVAHFHGGRAKRAPRFSIGFTIDIAKTIKSMSPRLRARAELLGPEVSFKGHFASFRSQPRLISWDLKSGDYGVSLGLGGTGKFSSISVSTPRGVSTVPGLTRVPRPQFGVRFLSDIIDFIAYSSSRPTEPHGESNETLVLTEDDVGAVRALATVVSRGLGRFRPHAFSPIRSEPQRTYEPGEERPTPSGTHSPLALSRLLDSSEGDNDAFAQALAKFGSESGLFEQIDVRHLGTRAESDPFQIQVKIRDQFRDSNIVDVGYGVSQVLPILVDSYYVQTSLFLLQQPEVHLHPRAQAELGSFLASQIATGRQFVVETHSDYLIDRVCMSVRDLRLDPSSVVLLFFEHIKTGVRISPIRVDQGGNLVDPPPTYRKFFLEEQRKFLGA